MTESTLPLHEALAALANHAGSADGDAAWPQASWDILRHAGVLGWTVPPGYGGAGRNAPDLLAGYGRLASACLTTCFLLSQRDAAVRRIRDSGNKALCRELLPPLARGERFATVGLSQLTTSRQHGPPPLIARATADGYIIDGAI